MAPLTERLQLRLASVQHASTPIQLQQQHQDVVGLLLGSQPAPGPSPWCSRGMLPSSSSSGELGQQQQQQR